jgi:riboflavin synthase
MFTGLVLCRGRVAARRPGRSETLLTVEAEGDLGEPLAVGESFSVSGACLTVTAVKGPRSFEAYVSAETLRVTTLGRIERVNLERALRLSDRLGGHLVLGHVDGLARLESASPAGGSLKCVFAFPPELAPYIVPKGSIAVDGVSLTVNEADSARFTVNLLPQTAESTTLASLRPGDVVNLETDVLGRHVKRLLETGAVKAPCASTPALSMEDLIGMGF